MKAKEYLSQAFGLDQRINSKLEQVASLRSLATRAAASLQAGRVCETNEHSPRENTLVKILDLENEIDEDIDHLVDLKREIMEVINAVEQPEHQLLLELRYLNFMTWEAIAERMNYSYRQIHRLHGQALNRLEDGTP
jgi:DNA-directed RNA polymerase specialized sigma subunit